MGEYVLERNVFHAGKMLITAGEPHTNAYIIQDGEVVSFMMDNAERIEVGRYGPGSIIGETNLLVDDKAELNFEAVVDTTVVTIVRQDFEKKLTKIDKTLMHIVQTLIKKLKKSEKEQKEAAIEAKRIDAKAFEIVEHLLRDMGDKERKKRYRDIIQPHFNIMCRSLEELKKEERHAKQKDSLDSKIASLQDDDSDDSFAEAADTD